MKKILVLLPVTEAHKAELAGSLRGAENDYELVYTEGAAPTADDLRGAHIVIGSSDCPKDVERLKSELYKVDETVLFLETNVGPVIGSHVGPGMLAIAFMGQDIREDLSVSDRIAKKVRSKE